MELGSDSYVQPGRAEWILKRNCLTRLDKVIHEDFPNAQRIDCPGHEALLKLAEGAAHAGSDAPSRPHPTMRSLF